jgi:thiamine pyrophosphokinase
MRAPKVLGVLAGRDLAPGALEAWLAWADLVIAADAGADLCRSAGREPDVIVGDLDSISDPTGLTPDPDQDSSDTDKLLTYLSENDLPSVTLIGVEGDRLDHVLATLYSCGRTEVECDLVLRTNKAKVCRAGMTIEQEAQGRISAIPLTQSRVTLTGVRWPLENAVLEPNGLVSLSNHMAEPSLRLEVHEGTVVLFLPNT